MSIINKKSNIIFVHVARTGGTSISDVDWIGGCGHTIARVLKSKCKKYQWEKFFKFSFVRNPYDRLVSAFFGYIPPGQKRTPSPRTRACYHWRFNDNDKTAFTKWVYELTQNWIRQHAHIMLQWKYILIKQKNEFDFIGRFENLQQDFNHICEKTNHEYQTLPHHRKETRREKMVKYYDQETADIVFELYKRDFNLFDYDRNSWKER